MPAPRPGGARFVLRRFLYLTPADLHLIGTAVRAAVPGLRFAMLPELVDRQATKEAGLFDQWRGSRQPVIATPAHTWTINYMDELNCPDDQRNFRAWLEPENWQPEWAKNEDGHPYITNGPDMLFDFRPCRIYAWGWDNMAGTAPPGCTPNQYLWLEEGSLSGVYYPWEPEKERLLRRVRRIFDKYTTNQCCYIEPATLKPKYIWTKGAEDRIGPQAAVWAMAHPRHLLGRAMLKPIEWAQKYPDGWRID